MTLLQRTKSFLSRHKKVLLITTAVYILLIVVLVALSMGPQTEPFVYQVR
jgi:cell division protein FtsL